MYNAQTAGVCERMKTKFQPLNFEKIQTAPHFGTTENWFHTRAQGEKLTLLTAVPDTKLALNMHWYPRINEIISGIHKFYEGFITRNYKVTLGRSFAVIEKVDTNQKWLTTREHYLCLMDVIAQRFMILLSTIIGSNYIQNVIPTPEVVLEIYDWGDSISSNCGNAGYDALKMWEAIVSSSILDFRIDPFIENQHFAKQTYESFVKAVPGCEQFLRNKLTRIKEILLYSTKLDWNYVTQLHGLYRIWGHPSIEGLLALAKLQVYGRRQRLVYDYSVLLVTNKFKEVFSFGYFEKYPKWPVFKIPEGDNNYLANTLRNDQLLDKKNPLYDSMNWMNIRFGKTFNPPEKYDISQTITDRSLSLNSDELYKAVKADNTIGHNRSVILQWLESSYEKPITFLNKISEYGFYGNQNVLGLYPKERELKTTARLFGMMPFEKRAFICLTEQMVADFILPCFSEITLTQSETRNLNTMHHTTKSAKIKSKDESSSVDVKTGLDFEKWNTNMRDRETRGIMECLDDLFGLVNVFTRGHSVFLNAGFYLADGSVTPEFEEEEYNLDLTNNALPDDPEWHIRKLWDPTIDEELIFDLSRRKRVVIKDTLGSYTGNIGGMEGMRQKVWAIFTVIIIKCVADMQQVPVKIIGQGDNQILNITYRKSDKTTIKEQHNSFMSDLEYFIALIGPPLNRTECWSSTFYFLYGKYPMIDGMPKSMSLKKICRMFRLNNDSLMNVDSVLGAISANASAATKMSFSNMVPFVIGKLESLGALELYLTCPIFTTNPPISHISTFESFKLHSPTGYDLIKYEIPDILVHAIIDTHEIAEVLSIVPSILGGYSNLMYQDLLLHGFPDPLTLSLFELQSYYKHLPKTKKAMKLAIQNLFHPQYNPYKEPSLLMENPVALNLKACSRPKDLVRTLIFSQLQKMPGIKNRPFKSMLKLAAKRQRLLARAIFSIHPFRSKVTQLLYESTVPSQASRVIRKVEKTRTMIKLTSETLLRENQDALRRNMDQDFPESSTKRSGTLNEFFYSKDQQYLRSLLYQVSVGNTDPKFNPSLKCTYEEAVRFRAESWGKHIEGISVPCPLSFLIIEEASINCEEEHKNPDAGYIQLITSLKEHEYATAFEEIGPSTPFFGSETRDKIEYEGKKLAKVVPSILTRATLNLEIVMWGTSLDSNLTRLIFGLFSAITNADPVQLIPSASNM